MKKIFSVLLALSLILMTSCSLITIEISESQLSDQSDTKSDQASSSDNTQEKTKADVEKFDNQINQSAPEIKTQENLLLTNDTSFAREVNIFLSNFSEVFYDPNLGFWSEAEEKINFAYLHAVINSSSLTFYKNGYCGISAANVDTILKRFFGSTIPHATPPNNKYWIYEGGNFLLPAASGESYPNFSIATSMTKLPDGNFDVYFNIYFDHTVGAGGVVTNKSLYSLTDAQASAKYQNVGYGHAVLKAKVYNSKNTYELVSYDVSHTS